MREQLHALENGEDEIQNLPVSATENKEIAVYGRPLPSFDEEISRSTNLINESAKHLFDTMREIKGAEYEGGGNAPLSKDDIDSICKCAREIQTLARVKLDLMKLKGK